MNASIIIYGYKVLDYLHLCPDCWADNNFREEDSVRLRAYECARDYPDGLQCDYCNRELIIRRKPERIERGPWYKFDRFMDRLFGID